MLLSLFTFIDNDADKDFIEKLYLKYIPLLKCRAHRFIDEPDVCEDLAHDCMINMIKHIDTLKKLSEVKQRAYISVSIDNVVKNYLRQKSKEGNVADGEAAELENIEDDYSIQSELEKKLQFESIKTGFDGLPAKDKNVLMMKYGLELDDSRIAEIMNIKKGSVRTAVFRSIRKLRKEIEKKESVI